jgi:hypothetical protein
MAITNFLSHHRSEHGGPSSAYGAGGRMGAELRDHRNQTSELCGEIHDRMLAILKPETWSAWLGEEPCDLASLKGAARATPVEENDVLAREPAGRKRQKTMTRA